MKPSLFLHPMARHGKIVSVSCVDKRKEIAWMIIQWQIMIVSFLYSFYLIFKIFYIVEIIFFVIIRILFKYIGIQPTKPLLTHEKAFLTCAPLFWWLCLFFVHTGSHVWWIHLVYVWIPNIRNGMTLFL